jgi:hypothetical protein
MDAHHFIDADHKYEIEIWYYQVEIHNIQFVHILNFNFVDKIEIQNT